MLLYRLADAPDLVLVMLHHFEGLAVLSSELCVSCGHPRHAKTSSSILLLDIPHHGDYRDPH